MEPARYRAFLEAHIEQGDRLEHEGLSIGVVTSIVAIWQYRITFEGEQNHAGTTRMAARRDSRGGAHASLAPDRGDVPLGLPDRTASGLSAA